MSSIKNEDEKVELEKTNVNRYLSKWNTGSIETLNDKYRMFKDKIS